MLMYMNKHRMAIARSGMSRVSEAAFALPMVMVASVILLTVLLTAVTAVSSLSVSLNEQVYNKLAEEAAESGLAYAQACLDINAAATWTELKSNTDCSGVEQVACPTSTRHNLCGVIDGPKLRAEFSVSTPVLADRTVRATSTGKVSLLRSSNSKVSQIYTRSMTRATTQVNDPASIRATQRYWYFGDVAVFDFGVSGTSDPVMSSGPAGTGSSEGTTVVTDKKGDLIFRSDGRSVWDKTGGVMQNSTGLNANNSTTQAAVAFPLDRQGVKYAIVTNTAVNEAGGMGELYYSIIDMSLNGGLGAVDPLKKNIKLGTGFNYSAEALTSAPNANGDGYWVYTFTPGTRNMLAFQFKLDGTVSSSPVVSLTSQNIPQCDPAYSGYGTLYFDKEFNRLLMSSSPAGCGAPNYNVSTLRMLDFNAYTGQLTEKYSWLAGTTQLSGISNAGYSADFSPAEKYVYATQLYPARIYRYNIEGATTGAAVKATEEFVGFPSSSYTGGGHVRRAPNGKMYVANNTFNNISVIQQPDSALTSIGWMPSGVTLPSGVISRFGLPQMVSLYDPRVVFY